MRNLFWLFFILTAVLITACSGQDRCSDYDIVWHSQSRNSSESMPCGGGDIGMNVWVEDGDLLFYLARCGAFDENNTLLKLGRIRIRFDVPLDSIDFTQRLDLDKGRVEIIAGKGLDRIKAVVWADVFHPVANVRIISANPKGIKAFYESWREEDRALLKDESYQNSYKWAEKGQMMRADTIVTTSDGDVMFYHRNPDKGTVFDVSVEEQQLSQVKDSLYNPLGGLISGGLMREQRGVFSYSLKISTRVVQESEDDWKSEVMALAEMKSDEKASIRWWQQFWDRSFIRLNEDSDAEDPVWKAGRNYQLFRYQLGCNEYGMWPTKFNGGLFTFDPVYVNPERPFTADFRNWGGGTFTAQNQRLVYFPMLKSGDTDMMIPQFDFYLRNLRNAELRTELFFGHKGASFTEQIDTYGLPNPSEYGWDHPDGLNPALEYNNWLEYLWDTSLEFCHMIFEARRYSGMDIEKYIPLVESCLTFFNEHYGRDENGKLVIYPGSACETYKLTLNASSTIAALRIVTEDLIEYGRDGWADFLESIPEIPLREIDGKCMISPAASWERINNTEAPQLYPVWPWRIYNIRSEDLETARNTYLYDPDVQEFRSHEGWKQYNIFAACLGLAAEAADFTLKKFEDSDHRFPTFWGPGFDWTPDHNWGGTAMIGLQEMLLQEIDGKILLFPAWPKEWDVHFKLHAHGHTTVEARMTGGKVELLDVIPSSRKSDIEIIGTK